MNVVIAEKVVKVVEVDWASLSMAVEAEVMDKLKYNLSTWQNDTAMKSMFLRDAADSLEVCTLLTQEKWFKAEERLWDMDTAPREYVFYWIEKHSCQNLFGILRQQEA